jgi:apolipoprotein N-acyltransferase
VWWLAKSSLFGFFVIIVSNSMYLALAIVLVYRIRQVFNMMFALISFVCIWVGFEYMHYWWELSWPFMNLGNWLGQTCKWIQWYQYTGVLGGTLWILSVNLLIYHIIKKIQMKQKMPAIIYSISVIAVIVLPMTLSGHMYKNYSDSKEELIFKLIQPNIDPYTEKYNTKLFEGQINKQIELAKDTTSYNPVCFLFPESSIPSLLNEDFLESVALTKITDSVLKSPNTMILGGMYSFRSNNGDTLFYNTAFCMQTNGKRETRHKSKLVIGVEKMPYQDYFGFLKKLNLDFGGFTNSLAIDKEPVVFKIPVKSYSIAPVICYESVYGQYVSEFVSKGASCIVVITNDAWWGDSPGYIQHLMHSKLRAIENRRSVARAANTGTTCIINGRGDIVNQITAFKVGVLTGTVSQNNQNTFYSKNGDYIGKIAFGISIIILILTIYIPIFQRIRLRKH